MNGTTAWLIVIIGTAVFILGDIAGAAWARSGRARAPGLPSCLSRVLAAYEFREAARKAQQEQDGGNEP